VKVFYPNVIITLIAGDFLFALLAELKVCVDVAGHCTTAELVTATRTTSKLLKSAAAK